MMTMDEWVYLEIGLFFIGQAVGFFMVFSRLMARVSVMESQVKGLCSKLKTMEERLWQIKD